MQCSLATHDIVAAAAVSISDAVFAVVETIGIELVQYVSAAHVAQWFVIESKCEFVAELHATVQERYSYQRFNTSKAATEYMSARIALLLANVIDD